MKVRFIPEVWIHDNAVECDPEGPDTYEVGEVPAGVDSGTYESDIYKDHENAPQWVKDWTGPFTIAILRDEQ